MLIKIPNRFVLTKHLPSVKKRDLYINTDQIQAIEVQTYDYGSGEEHYINLISLSGYINLGICQCVTEEIKNDFLEWIDEVCKNERTNHA